MKTRIAVLASGGGSNLGALLEHFDLLSERARGEVVLVASNVASAGALDRARTRGIAAEHVRTAADIAPLLERAEAEIVVLAGYLRLVPPSVVRAYHGRMLNVHPALLPAFGGPGMYGARVHQAVLDSGARVSGATVHFVSEDYDRGAIVAQWPVPVFEEDSADDLARRVLAVEHALLPRVVNALAADAVALDDDGRVRGAFLVGQQGAAFTLPRAHTDLGQEIDAAMA